MFLLQDWALGAAGLLGDMVVSLSALHQEGVLAFVELVGLFAVLSQDLSKRGIPDGLC